MTLPTFLAHGVLGAFDELMFAGVAVVFLVMMGISWVRSRSFEPEWEDEHTAPENSAESAENPSEQSTDSEHFRLD